MEVGSGVPHLCLICDLVLLQWFEVGITALETGTYVYENSRAASHVY